MATALVVIGVQDAFIADRDEGYPWANPDAPDKIAALLAGFRKAGLPVIHVHHHGTDPRDSFHPSKPTAAPMQAATPVAGEAVVIKTGSSAFIGAGLEATLARGGI